MNSERVSWAWLRSLSDVQLRLVYDAMVYTDEYLNFGDAESTHRDLRRVRDVLEERGLL